MRILIAGVLGGIAMFIWASIAHVATPLATAGLQPLPNETATVAALHQQLGDKGGLYFFPYASGTDSKTMAAQEAKLKVGPSGLLAYQGPTPSGAFGRQLAVELALEVVESLLTAAVLVFAATFGARMGLAVAIGAIAAMATNFSYWNWYGFSDAYTLANAFTELVKFVVAGAVIALVLRGRAKAA
jgi:hypothetical protein